MIEAYTRQLFSDLTESDYDKAYYVARNTLAILRCILSSGVEPKSPFLAHYHNFRVMAEKVLRPDSQGGYWYMFKEVYQGEERRSIQVLILDTKKERILVQRRGPFKRLFPSKYTVSANINAEKGYLDKVVAKAVKQEVGIDIDLSKIQVIGKDFCSHMTSYDFYALTDEEEQKLKTVYERNKGNNTLDGVTVDYSQAKRCLCVLSTSASLERDRLLSAVEEIRQETQVPFMYPVYDKSRNTLVMCLSSEKVPI